MTGAVQGGGTGEAVSRETQAGRLVDGRYRLLDRLGEGGFGRVWRAHDAALNVEVAVKEVWLPETMSPDERAQRLRRAEREAHNAARLRDHPNIVAVYDVVVDDDAPWIVMRLVHGLSLDEHVRAHGPLSVAEATTVASALLAALGAAHEAGVLHRDVKPANVMLASNGTVLLTDFGIAVHHTDGTLTATGAFIGSVEYIAPERARGLADQPAGDLFSLGVTLYQAIEGFSPFRRATPTGSLAAVLLETAPPPRQAGRLAPLLAGLLEKDPTDRLTIPQALALLQAAPGQGEKTTVVRPVAVATAPVPDPASAPPAPRPSTVPPRPPIPPRTPPGRRPTPIVRILTTAVAVAVLATGTYFLLDEWSSGKSDASSSTGLSPTSGGAGGTPSGASSTPSGTGGTPTAPPSSPFDSDPWSAQAGDCVYVPDGPLTRGEAGASALRVPCSAENARYKVTVATTTSIGCASVPGWDPYAGGLDLEDFTHKSKVMLCVMRK
jgi:serine/threonine protein kinase